MPIAIGSACMHRAMPIHPCMVRPVVRPVRGLQERKMRARPPAMLGARGAPGARAQGGWGEAGREGGVGEDESGQQYGHGGVWKVVSPFVKIWFFFFNSFTPAWYVKRLGL